MMWARKIYQTRMEHLASRIRSKDKVASRRMRDVAIWAKGWLGFGPDRTRWVPTACLIFLLALFSPVEPAVASGLSARLNLVVEAEQGGPRFLCLPVHVGEEFQIEFLHSYDRFPFKEFYRVEKGLKIRLFKMVFRSLLNGQGFVYPGVRIRPDGWGEINDIASLDDRVEFIMGAREHANHRLTLGGIEYTLSDMIASGTIVEIRVQEAACKGSSREVVGDFGHAR